MAALAAAFSNPASGLQKVQIPAEPDASWSSLRRRGDVRPLEDSPPPQLHYPAGRRFVVDDRSVYWNGYSFHVGESLKTGPVLRDIRFKGQRLAYEIALQDVFTAYSSEWGGEEEYGEGKGGMAADVHFMSAHSIFACLSPAAATHLLSLAPSLLLSLCPSPPAGNSPSQGSSVFTETGWGLGRSLFSLVEGVDCPKGAVFLHRDFMQGTIAFGADKPYRVSRFACVFEALEQSSLTRHCECKGGDGSEGNCLPSKQRESGRRKGRGSLSALLPHWPSASFFFPFSPSPYLPLLSPHPSPLFTISPPFPCS